MCMLYAPALLLSHSNASMGRLKYIMLLKLPIILSSNSLNFDPLFPKLFPAQSIINL